MTHDDGRVTPARLAVCCVFCTDEACTLHCADDAVDDTGLHCTDRGLHSTDTGDIVDDGCLHCTDTGDIVDDGFLHCTDTGDIVDDISLHCTDTGDAVDDISLHGTDTGDAVDDSGGGCPRGVEHFGALTLSTCLTVSCDADFEG